MSRLLVGQLSTLFAAKSDPHPEAANQRGAFRSRWFSGQALIWFAATLEHHGTLEPDQGTVGNSRWRFVVRLQRNVACDGLT